MYVIVTIIFYYYRSLDSRVVLLELRKKIAQRKASLVEKLLCLMQTHTEMSLSICSFLPKEEFFNESQIILGFTPPNCKNSAMNHCTEISPIKYLFF